MNTIRYEFNEAEIQEIFEQYIVHRVFDTATPALSGNTPITVLIGAQPAAGKTSGQKRTIELYNTELIPIIGDDFRQFHPQYDEIMDENPLSMPDATKQLSARLVEKSIEYANKHGFSTIIEGTWRSSDVVMNTAQAAKDYGREVHLTVLATKPAISRIGMFSRYYDDTFHGIQARWTPPAAHETVLKNLDSNIMNFALSGLFDRYKAITRSGKLLYDGTDGKAWHDAWRDEFTAPLTAEEQRFVDARSERYVRLAGEYTPEHVREVDSVLSAARTGGVDPLIYVEPYMRNGKPVSGYFRHAPTHQK